MEFSHYPSSAPLLPKQVHWADVKRPKHTRAVIAKMLSRGPPRIRRGDQKHGDRRQNHVDAPGIFEGKEGLQLIHAADRCIGHANEASVIRWNLCIVVRRSGVPTGVPFELLVDGGIASMRHAPGFR